MSPAAKLASPAAKLAARCTYFGSEVETAIKAVARNDLDLLQSCASMLFDAKSPQGTVENATVPLLLPSPPWIPTVTNLRRHRAGMSMLAGNSPASYHYETTVGGALPVISTLQVRAELTGCHHGFVWYCLCFFELMHRRTQPGATRVCMPTSLCCVRLV